jgi:hypothetical protein
MSAADAVSIKASFAYRFLAFAALQAFFCFPHGFFIMEVLSVNKNKRLFHALLFCISLNLH